MEFRILGEVGVEADGRFVPLGGLRQSAVLAILLLEAGRPVSPVRINELLWPQDEPRDSGAVQVYVSRLRAALRAADAERYGTRIRTTAGGYRLELGGADLDVQRFRDLVDAAGAARPEEGAALLRQALAVWRGPALAGLPDQVRAIGAELEEARLVAFEHLMRIEIAAGRYTEVVPPLTEAVSRHPSREGLAALLMDALYRLGRWGDALAQYESIRRSLAGEFGIDPGPHLRRLHAEILRADAAAQPAEAREDEPPRPSELPPDVPGFTGRAAELGRLDAVQSASAAAPGAMVVAITGAGGVGKTSLVVHWAQRVADRFPDGQLYVDLRGYSTVRPMQPLEALARFLRALGVPPARIPTDVDESSAAYRTLLRRRRVLVLLDNAADADQIRPLLPGGSASLTVITSRNRLTGLLARDGAARIELNELTEVDAVALLETIIGADRVRGDQASAAAFVDACARLPLALRIGAAKLADASDAAIATFTAALRTTRALDVLAVDGDSQASVRAAFDLSYSALPAATRRMFRLLGLHPGAEMTVDVAAALADVRPADAELLVVALMQASLVEPAGPQRYTQHDLLRQYSADLAARDESPADAERAFRRLATWYLLTADAAARVLYPQRLRLPLPEEAGFRPVRGFVGHVDALAWFDAERSNIVATIQQAAETGMPALAVLLADTARGYFGLRLPIVEWRTAATAARTAAQVSGDHQGEGAAEMSLAECDLRQSRYAEAIDHYRRAIELYRKAGWPEGESAVAANLGSVYWEAGHLADAADICRQALTLDRRHGRRDLEATKLGLLGLINFETGDLADAARHHADAAAIHGELGSPSGEATDLLNLGEALHALGHFQQARRELHRGLDLCRETGNGGSETEVLRVLAELHGDLGEHAAAEQMARSAVAMAQDTENVRFVAHAVNTLAGVHTRAGLYEAALPYFRRALALARRHGIRTAEVTALIGLGTAGGRLGRPGTAYRSLTTAARMAESAGYRVPEGRARTVLADLLRACGRDDRARHCAEQALRLHRATGHRLGEVHTLAVLGGLSGWSNSSETWQRAAGLFADLGARGPSDLWYLIPGDHSRSNPA